MVAGLTGAYATSTLWDAWQIGASVGVGGSLLANLGRGTSYTVMLNDEKATRNRSIMDLLNNFYQQGRYGYTYGNYGN